MFCKQSNIGPKAKDHTCGPAHSSSEFLQNVIFVTQFFVQSGKFGFQLSYQTFSIRLKTVGDKKTHNSTTEAVVEESD